MNQNIIVDTPAGEIRAIAWKELKGNFKQIMMVGFVFLLLTSFASSMLAVYTPSLNLYTDFDVTYRWNPFSALYELFIVPVLAVGLFSFFLMYFRQKKYEPKRLFDGFHYFFKCVALDIILFVKIFLWTCLLFIPGIFAAIRYSQARFILAEDPSKSPSQCIEESKFLMRGNGGSIFILILSFIGWAILAALPPAILYAFWGQYSEVGAIVTSLVECVTSGAFFAYFYLSMTIFFEIVSGHLRFRTTPTYNTYQERYANTTGSSNAFGQTQQTPYGQSQQTPYGQPQQNPYGQPQQNPYGQPVTPPSNETAAPTDAPAQDPVQKPETPSTGYAYPGTSSQTPAEPSVDTPVEPAESAEPTSDPFRPQDPQ